MYFYIYVILLAIDDVVLSLAGPSALSAAEPHKPVDCVRAGDMCSQSPQCSSRYRVMRQCLVGRDRNMLANRECQEALEVLQDSPLFHCRCKRGMKKELQCLQSYWTIHKGLADDDEFYEASPYEPVDSLRLASIISGMHTSTTRSSPQCQDSSRTCNPCLDATKACNLNDVCKRQRSLYISYCNKGSGHPSSEPCSRNRCHKHLRQFFDRIQNEYGYGLLFCSCRDAACAERRRQTIVPQCSYEDKSKPNCLRLRSDCREEQLCRSRLADFHTNCRVSPEYISSCPNENYQACLASYAGLIGTVVTPNYVDSSPSDFIISPWCSCHGSGNQEAECERFLLDFRNNTCLRNAIQAFGHGTDRPKPATVPPTTSVKPEPEMTANATTKEKMLRAENYPCAFPTCSLEYGDKCSLMCEDPPEVLTIPMTRGQSSSLTDHAQLWIACLTSLLGSALAL
ncbi:GDNF family receptor alpha-2-like isoform X2 [Denticeps clupeoides]|uniref:GDNF family receptor alpha-2-like isoform X2 n=1 Tax=Denticeps clupeoides TaxID=299321 RepID=UPI0010A35108|nr:GDNF family receptor alpha-2-like isoform X2 [Denticeps clupeoides]